MDMRKNLWMKIIAGLLSICLSIASLFVEFYGFPLLAAQEDAEAFLFTPSEGEEIEEEKPEEDTEIFQENMDSSEKSEEAETEKFDFMGDPEETETEISDFTEETETSDFTGEMENPSTGWTGSTEEAENPDTEIPFEGSPGEAAARRHKISTVVDYMEIEDSLRKDAPSCGIISTDTTWTAGMLSNGELVINEGVTLTINGLITISGNITIKGGGRILRGNVNAYFYVGSDAELTIGNVTIEGNSLTSTVPIVSVNHGKVILDDGCIVQNCIRSGPREGTVVSASYGEVVFNDIIVQNCVGCGWGGVVSLLYSTMTINGGLYQNNQATGQFVGTVVYNMYSKLYIYGGRFIGNISNGVNASGCITDIGCTGNETYIYGGYFEGNKSITSGFEGGGAVFLLSSHNSQLSKDSIFCMSGDVQFCGDGVEGSGIDGIFMEFEEFPQKMQVSSPLNSPVYVYLKATEGYVIAKGANNGYTLQERDMNQIYFTDISNSEKKWYAWLNKETNEIYLSEEIPPYGCYVYYSGNGAEGIITDDTEYVVGETAIVKSDEGFIYEGYIFDGWNTQPDGKGISYEAGDEVEIADSLTLYAQWVKEDEIPLKANFYSGAARHIEQIKVLAEDPVITTPPLEEMDGWTAVGWDESASGYAGSVPENTELTLTEDVSYYGVYKKDVTLSYDVNGGSNAPENETKTCYANVHDEITYTYGVDTQFIVGHEAVPGIEDAVFMGWNDKEDGTGTLYREGDTLILTDDTTLYAVYEVPPFATFYFGTGGNYVKRGVNLLTGNRTIEVPGKEEMEVLDMTGWTALGFNEAEDDCVYGESTLNAGTTLTLGEEYLTFYGIYEKEASLTYAYTYTSSGEKIIEKNKKTCNANVNISGIKYQNPEGLSASYDGFKFTVDLGEDDLEIPAGYKFAGWSTDTKSEGQVYEEGDEITIYEDTTLYAQWSLMDFEVDFDLNGGKGDTPETQVVPYGGLLMQVTDPAKKGYSFSGWYKDVEGTEGSRWDFAKNVEQNTSEYKVTLYARYIDDIAPVLGDVSYNEGYKDMLNWIVRKKNLILTVPIIEEGSGIKEASYTLMPEEETENIMTDGKGRSTGMTYLADIIEENGQIMAKITVAEDFKGKISMICFDNAGNISPSKMITASNGGVIVEDNAPEITFTFPDRENSDYSLDQESVNVRVEDSGEKDSENERVTGGISKVSYRVDNGEEIDMYGMIFQNALVDSCNFTVNITGEGSHTLSVTAVDNAGNETMAQTDVVIYGEHIYTVEYYKQNVTGDGYTKEDSETEYLTGTTGSAVTAEMKQFTGFTENISHDERIESGIITMDDALVLKLYYDRDIYEIAFDLNGMEGEEPETQTVRYGGFLEKVEDPSKKGYSFRGWYTEKEEMDGREWDFDETVENNTAFHTITLYARCEDDIAPVLGQTSYGSGYKNIKNWMIHKKSMVITVPIIEEGSGVDRAEYVLIPEGKDETIGKIISDNTKESGVIYTSITKESVVNRTLAAKTGGKIAKIKKEDGQYVAKITIEDDFKGSILLSCDDKAGNHSIEKTVTIAGGGVIVEDNAPKISFSSKKGDLSGWFLDKADIKVTVEDGKNETITGGIASISYQIDDGKAKMVDPKNFDGKMVEACDFTVTISGAAEHTLMVTALDNAGNKSVSKTRVKIKNEVYIADTITYYPNDLPKSGEPKIEEPKTGDSMQVELFATIAMLSFFVYLLLYFFAGEREMVEEKIKRHVSRMVWWKKDGKKYKILLADIVIFFLLFYYYSIGKLATVSWRKVYEVHNG